MSWFFSNVTALCTVYIRFLKSGVMSCPSHYWFSIIKHNLPPFTPQTIINPFRCVRFEYTYILYIFISNVFSALFSDIRILSGKDYPFRSAVKYYDATVRTRRVTPERKGVERDYRSLTDTQNARYVVSTGPRVGCIVQLLNTSHTPLVYVAWPHDTALLPDRWMLIRQHTIPFSSLQ